MVGGGGGTSAPVSGGFTGTDSFGNSVSSSDGSGGGFGAGDSGADGTSGEGKPFPNAAIKLTDLTDKSVTVQTDATGYYRAKITGFTAPIIASATLGSKTYYSFTTVEPKANGFITINITGLTDKIASDVALAAGLGLTSSASITSDIVSYSAQAISKALADLRTTLASELVAKGLDKATFDPLTMPFKADGKGVGYDGVLDTTLVTKTGSGATQITQNGQAPSVGIDTSGVAVFISELNRYLASPALRQNAGFADLITNDYRDGSDTKTTFLARLRSDTNSYSIQSPSARNCGLYFGSTVNGGCGSFNGIMVPSSLAVAKLQISDNQLDFTAGVWRLIGNQNPSTSSFSIVAATPLATPTINFTASGSPTITLTFAEDMNAFYGTTGAYNPASSTWPTLRTFRIVFNSYVSGGTITFQKASFSSTTGKKMANDITYTFP